ncbi:hypothetical protein BJX99DRAFT_163198 [Aspergillus californicus]
MHMIENADEKNMSIGRLLRLCHPWGCLTDVARFRIITNLAGCVVVVVGGVLVLVFNVSTGKPQLRAFPSVILPPHLYRPCTAGSYCSVSGIMEG